MKRTPRRAPGRRTPATIAPRCRFERRSEARERTPLDGDFDVVICGASFAGLAVARELRGSGARVLRRRPLRDRRAADVGLRRADRVAREPRARGLDPPDVPRPRGPHARGKTYRWTLPWTFSTFDYRELCALLAAQGDVHASRRPRSTGSPRGGRSHTVHTDRGDLRAPLVVDALGWRRVLSDRPTRSSRRTRACRAAWRCIRRPAGEDLELWLDPKYIVPPATRGRSRPATRSASASARSTRACTSRSPTVQLADDLGRRRAAATRATGSPTACAPRAERRRLLRRRQRRPLPADDRRGHPHGALLRPGLRPRAARA